MTHTTDQAVPPAKPKRRHGLKIALVISLALNLLIIGLIIGALSHRWRDPDMRQDRALADLGFSPYVAALDPEDRHDLGREMFKRAGDFRRNRQEIQAEFAAIVGLLREPEFDPQSLRDRLLAQGKKLEERRATGIELFIVQLSKMDQEKRAAVADRLERLLKRLGP